MRELYTEENKGKTEPSGAQDMVGLVYPSIVRMDFDIANEGGYFPMRVEICEDPDVVFWVEKTIKIIPIAQRPSGYNPLGIKNLDPGWVKRLGESGRNCFDAIVGRDLGALQASMNECMLAWEALLPSTLRHPLITVDLVGIMDFYRKEYGGAMYSGCGGGYLFVASNRNVPGSIGFRVRRTKLKA